MRNIYKIFVTILSIFSLMIAPLATASSNAFESQVFHQSSNDSVQELAELSHAEMKETEGAWAHVVYGLMIGSRVAYVGVTNNLKRRAAAHAATKTFDRAKPLGIYTSRTQARIAEQNYINRYNTINNGMNKINSISPRNPLSQRVTVPYRNPK